MKKIFMVISGLLLSMAVQADDFESATDAVKNMGVGWNLGNTLDANGKGISDVVRSETYWGQPVTKPELMTMMKGAGIGAIRVPVTWYNHSDEEGNIDAAWLKRVHEVVDYVIDAGLYCVINVHHDTGAHDNAWVIADADNYAKTKARFENLWTQIATEFKDYDEHLLFAGYNEMLDKLNSWCYASFASSAKYDETIATSAYSGLNSYAQSFVDVVRATGGNNAQRNLIINTYASANGSGSWNNHLTDVLTQLTAPTDVTENHLAYEVHAYPTLSSGKSEVDDIIKKVNKYLLPKGPIIIGEWGTSNVDKTVTDYDSDPEKYLEFCQYFVEQAKANNIATFYWMGLSDGSYRNGPYFNQPDIAKTITKAYHGQDFEGVYPTVNPDADITVWEGNKLLKWGDGVTVGGEIFAAQSSENQLQLTYSQENDNDAADIQLFYGDWSTKVPSTVEGTQNNGDFMPKKVYGTGAGATHTTAFTFDETVLKNLSKKGLIIHGVHIRLTQVSYVSTTGINSPVILRADAPIYNLNGQRIVKPSKGIYIQNGRKLIAN